MHYVICCGGKDSTVVVPREVGNITTNAHGSELLWTVYESLTSVCVSFAPGTTGMFTSGDCGVGMAITVQNGGFEVLGGAVQYPTRALVYGGVGATRVGSGASGSNYPFRDFQIRHTRRGVTVESVCEVFCRVFRAQKHFDSYVFWNYVFNNQCRA
ncbi:hypothetical protein BC629DRAFT_1442586 [Irpex lacteus]|nr:hypothetical protein BC629DRAFT_1442586 [Irpex lacteus]